MKMPAVTTRALAKKYEQCAALLIVALASLVFQLAFLAALPPAWRRNQSSDFTRFYAPVAENILAGQGVCTSPGQGPAIRYPPGYPVALAVIWAVADLAGYSRTAAVMVFNVVVTVLGCLLLFLLLERVFSTRVGLLAALLWATYPLALWLVKQPNSEVVFIPLLYLGLWLFLRHIEPFRPAGVLVAGVVLGLAALVRPIGILLGLALAVAVLCWRVPPRPVRLRLAVLVLAGFVAAVLPWEGYVAAATGRLIPLSTGGRPGLVDGLTYALDPGAGGDRAGVTADVRALMERIRADSDAQPTGGALLRGVAQEVARDPVATGRLLALKAGRCWYGTDEMWHERSILLLQTLYLIPVVVGIRLGLRRRVPARRAAVLLLVVTVYFWAMATAALSIVRYMVPAMGLLFGFAALAGERLGLFFARTPTPSPRSA